MEHIPFGAACFFLVLGILIGVVATLMACWLDGNFDDDTKDK